MADLRTLIRPDEPALLWAISVDSAAQSKAFAAEIAADGRGRVAFGLLSDPDHRVIDAYGLQDPRYARLGREGIPYPATFIVDRDGRIAWARIDKDYTRRPPIREVRAALDASTR